MTLEPNNPAAALLDALKDRAPYVYLMTWYGSKIPRGASIAAVQIGWTQHGRIVGGDGEDLGVYERLEEFGGDNGDRHLMAVLVDANVEVIDPDGKSIRPAVRPGAENDG